MGARAFRPVQLFVWTMALLALVALPFAVVTADLGWDEWEKDGRRFVIGLDPGGAAERAGIVSGDEILADPIPLSETERGMAAWFTAAHRAYEQGRVPVRIRREGAEQSVVIAPRGPTMATTLRRLRALAPALPTMFGDLAVSILLARRPSRPERGRGLLAASFACFALSKLAEVAAPSWPTWMLVGVGFVAANLGPILGNALAVWFFAIVPERLRAAGPIAAVAVAGALGIGGLTVLVDLGIASPPFDVGALYRAWQHGTVAAMIALAVWQRARAQSALARRQATWLMLIVGSVLIVSLMARLRPSTLTMAASLLWNTVVPLGFAAVITRYRLFALDARAPAVAAYALMVTVSLLVYFAVFALVDATVRATSGSWQAAPLVAGVGVVLAGEPLRALARRAIDRLFARDRRAFHARCAQLVARLDGTSPEDALSLVQATLDVRTAVWLPGDVLDADMAELARSGVLCSVELDEPARVDALLARGVDLVVAVPVDGEVRALGIGTPLATTLLGRGERDTLAAAGKALGVALGHRAARRALVEEVERRARERERIARDLHDGVGATLTAARLMTQLARRVGGGERETELLARLEGTLHDGMAELHAALWSLDPRETTWGELVARVRRHVADVCLSAGLELRFEAAGDVGVTPSPAVKLALLRLSQEALSNVVRHTRARAVRLRLTAELDEHTLVFEDDGGGIVAAREGGRGLANMAARVEELGGVLRFETLPAGTRIVARIPASPVRARSPAAPATLP
jgi:signal transduction histidine kinase